MPETMLLKSLVVPGRLEGTKKRSKAKEGIRKEASWSARLRAWERPWSGMSRALGWAELLLLCLLQNLKQSRW